MFFQKYLDPKNDLAFKKIFGQEKHKQIPIAFLNAVFNFTKEDTIVDLTFLNVVQPPEIQSRKESVVDVLVRDQKGSKYIIEMQVAKVEGFEKRAQYYAAKTYSSNFNVGYRYEDLNKVIFLAITSYIVFPEKESYKSDHWILDSVTYENDLKDFSFTFVELPKFRKTLAELESLEDKWYYFLKHAYESRDIADILEQNPEIKAAYTVLESSQWTEQELMQYEQVAMAAADAEGRMIAAKKDGFLEGKSEGIAAGRAEGIQKGIETGKQEEKIALAEKLLRKNFPLEEITELSGLSIQELQELNLIYTQTV